MEILSTWKIKRTIKRKKRKMGRRLPISRNSTREPRKFAGFPREFVTLRVAQFVFKISTFGYFDGTAWTLHLKSPSPIMTADNALFVSRPSLRNFLPTSLPVLYPHAVFGRSESHAISEGKSPETRLIFFLRFNEITSLPDPPQWDWAVPLKHPRSVQMPTPGQYQNFIFLQKSCKCHIYGNLWKSESKHWL